MTHICVANESRNLFYITLKILANEQNSLSGLLFWKWIFFFIPKLMELSYVKPDFRHSHCSDNFAISYAYRKVFSEVCC